MEREVSMLDDLHEAKRTLRGQTLARLAGMTDGERRQGSECLCALLRRQRVWRDAKTVLLFAPMPGEPDIWPLLEEALRHGKSVALPRYERASNRYLACSVAELERDVAPGYYGIREPAPHCPELTSNRLDLILAPGVAFDQQGGRLGRGRGYYDRMLAVMRGIRCGVAFDQQIVPEVPLASHDARMNHVVTPTRWISV
jgi:5-formyltetrahydrofolate cyclo-ligase